VPSQHWAGAGERTRSRNIAATDDNHDANSGITLPTLACRQTMPFARLAGIRRRCAVFPSCNLGRRRLSRLAAFAAPTYSWTLSTNSCSALATTYHYAREGSILYCPLPVVKSGCQVPISAGSLLSSYLLPVRLKGRRGGKEDAPAIAWNSLLRQARAEHSADAVASSRDCCAAASAHLRAAVAPATPMRRSIWVAPPLCLRLSLPFSVS